MLVVLLSMCPLQFSNSFSSEVQRTLDFGFDQKVEGAYPEPTFTAKITFDPLPEFLKTSTVHVKIQAMRALDSSVEFVIWTAYNNLIGFSRLTPSTWRFPIKKGDIFEGSFTITPREIGRFSFTIIPRSLYLNIGDRFGFFLTIDESTELVYLSKRSHRDRSQMVIHPPVAGDEIELKYRYRTDLNGSILDDFTNVFNISPLPALNETSTVRFQLMANRECPEGVQLYFYWKGAIEVFDLPDSWIGEVKRGEVHTDSFKVVPRTTGCGWLTLWMRAHSPPKSDESDKWLNEAKAEYELTVFIDESGQLTFIGREPPKKMEKACWNYRGTSYASQPKVFLESQLKKKKTQK